MQAANSELGLSRKRGAEHDPFGQHAALHQQVTTPQRSKLEDLCTF